MAARPIRAHGRPHDPAEAVGTVLAAKRDILLRAHRHRLEREDLEDCLSQAALELIGRVRGKGFHDERHIANALEQKFLSRVMDRQRALAGRSAIVAVTHDAVRLGTGGEDEGDRSPQIAGPHGDPSDAVLGREQLQRLHEVAADLTEDQRLVLACQVSLGMDCAEFCERFGWSVEKFRKVAQRARARLRTLLTEYELGERCERLEGDVVAYAAHAASAQQTAAVRQHLANCAGCAALVRDLRLTSDRVAALLPIPVLAKAGVAYAGGLLAKAAAVWRAATSPFGGSTPAAGAGTTAAGGTVAGLTKTGIAALCAAGVAAGGHAALRELGPKERATTARRAATASAPTPAGQRSASMPKAPTLRVARPNQADRGRRRSHSRRRSVSGATHENLPAFRSVRTPTPRATALPARAARSDRAPRPNVALTASPPLATPKAASGGGGEFSVE